MPKRIVLSSDEDIYTDYLIALISNKTISTVLEKHHCSHRHVNNVVKRVEKKHKYTVGEHARKQMYEFKYGPMLRQKNSKTLVNAIIKDMYVRSGFSVSEIADHTKITKREISGVLAECV